MAWEWLGEAIGSRSLGALKAGAVGSYHGRNNPDFWSEEEKAGWNVFERALYDPEISGLPFGMSDIDVRLEGEGLLPSTIYVGEEGYRRPLPSGSTTDLAAHYDISRQLADRFGKIPAASMGLYQEIQNKISDSPGQFSLDDLLANYAGYMGITPEQAAEAGVFEHTEEDVTGAGQGLWKENWKKLMNLHKGSFPFVRGIIGRE